MGGKGKKGGGGGNGSGGDYSGSGGWWPSWYSKPWGGSNRDEYLQARLTREQEKTSALQRQLDRSELQQTHSEAAAQLTSGLSGALARAFGVGGQHSSSSSSSRHEHGNKREKTEEGYLVKTLRRALKRNATDTTSDRSSSSSSSSSKKKKKKKKRSKEKEEKLREKSDKKEKKSRFDLEDIIKTVRDNKKRRKRSPSRSRSRRRSPSRMRRRSRSRSRSAPRTTPRKASPVPEARTTPRTLKKRTPAAKPWCEAAYMTLAETLVPESVDRTDWPKEHDAFLALVAQHCELNDIKEIIAENKIGTIASNSKKEKLESVVQWMTEGMTTKDGE